MLTSAASQYLHPDYLQPLPTTLDAKKSPLALLAQTCSSIGKDTSPSKTIIPPLDKKEKEHGNKSPSSKHSPDANKSTPTSDKRDTSSVESNNKPGFRTVPPKDIPPLVPISTSRNKSPATSSNSNSPTIRGDNTSVTSATLHPITVPSTGAQSNSRISLSCGNMLLEVNHNESSSTSGVHKLSSSVPPSSHHHSGTVLKPDSMPFPTASLPPSFGPYPGCPTLPYLGHPGLGLDPAAAQAYSMLGAHAALGLSGGHKSGSLPPSGHTPGSALSPYVAYARVKTASGASTLVPICRDPYCTNCQLTLQSAQMTCSSGCTQCNHEKSLTIPPTSLPGYPSLCSASSMPLMGSLAMAGAANSSVLSSLYPHGLLPGHHVCNWVSGTEYCGKRFTTSEELLQHLRTHTSLTDSALSSLAYSSALPSAYSGCPTHYTTAAAMSSLSPESLRRAYPTSLSPSALAANRFHPYKSVYTMPTSPMAGLPLSVGPYYSPYSLYGPRLGAALAP